MWLADLWWPRRTEPGRVLEGQTRAGTEEMSRTQGQSRPGVSRAEHSLTYGGSPGWGPCCRLRVVHRVSVTMSGFPGNVHLT